MAGDEASHDLDLWTSSDSATIQTTSRDAVINGPGSLILYGGTRLPNPLELGASPRCEVAAELSFIGTDQRIPLSSTIDRVGVEGNLLVYGAGRL
jgi:hypothetical protein